jgi:hypothetical protein
MAKFNARSLISLTSEETSSFLQTCLVSGGGLFACACTFCTVASRSISLAAWAVIAEENRASKSPTIGPTKPSTDFSTDSNVTSFSVFVFAGGVAL